LEILSLSNIAIFLSMCVVSKAEWVTSKHAPVVDTVISQSNAGFEEELPAEKKNVPMVKINIAERGTWL
jgi:hypothetical protein